MKKLKLRINKIFNYIFNEKFYQKHHFDWGKYPNRSQLIQDIIDFKKYKSYLEIGCDDDVNYNKILVEKKIGVDPLNGGNIRKTSDDFFIDNKDYFDCIFIDGLHEYDQVKKDIHNALKFLEEDGIIFLHDCLPRSLFEQAVPRSQHIWTGDVWKAIVEIRTHQDVDTCVCLMDMGVGIIIKRANSALLNISIKDFKKLKFSDYFHNYQKYMNVIEYEKIMKFINRI